MKAGQNSVVVGVKAGQFNGSSMQHDSREQAGSVTSRQAQQSVDWDERQAGNPRVGIYWQAGKRQAGRQAEGWNDSHKAEHNLAKNHSKSGAYMQVQIGWGATGAPEEWVWCSHDRPAAVTP